MSLLEKPEAQALLEDACLSAASVRACSEHLSEFLQRYLPCFYREEQRTLAEVVIKGKLSGLQRKTSEPIAYQAGKERKPVQHFVGAGLWDDEAVMAEIRLDVGQQLGDASGVMIVDGSAFPKKGTESCGVDRQWCGRLGKLDNCQVGVFLAYASADGWAPLDRRLYLTKEWAEDKKRRQKTHVPKEVVFQEKWRIALDLIAKSVDLRHGWIAADDEFGRVTEFRATLRQWQERYVVDVPCNTLVRDVSAGPRGPEGPQAAFEQAKVWAARQPASRWKTITIRAGEKGPLRVKALKARVQTKEEHGRLGPNETLLVVRTLDQKPTTYYALSNADRGEKLHELARVKSQRHCVEELLEEAKGEVGLGHYEVRSWVGWHHHMTLSLLALWFLTVQKRRVGKKNTGHHGAADPGDFHALAASAAADSRTNCRRDQSCSAA
jgi:SRSO17 transposase